MFQVGSTYSRLQINAAIGGGTRACLLTSRGEVVGVCFTPEMNPQAPRIILVGRGAHKEKAARMLVEQTAPVPVFQKKAPGAYEHLGQFRGQRYTATRREAARQRRKSGRKDVKGSLLLAPA